MTGEGDDAALADLEFTPDPEVVVAREHVFAGVVAAVSLHIRELDSWALARRAGGAFRRPGLMPRALAWPSRNRLNWPSVSR